MECAPLSGFPAQADFVVLVGATINASASASAFDFACTDRVIGGTFNFGSFSAGTVTPVAAGSLGFATTSVIASSTPVDNLSWTAMSGRSPRLVPPNNLNSLWLAKNRYVNSISW